MNHVFFLRIMAAIAIFFGIATIKEGGAVLFFEGEARIAAGYYVPFVLWFNFFIGFFYVLSGVGLWFIRSWSVKLALFIFLSTGLVFIALSIHVWSGRLYENRTVLAMTMRTVVWALISFAGYYLYQRKQTGLVK